MVVETAFYFLKRNILHLLVRKKMFSGRRVKDLGRLAWTYCQDCQTNVLFLKIKNLRKKFPKKLFVFFFSDVHGDLIEIVAKFFEIVLKTAFVLSRKYFGKIRLDCPDTKIETIVFERTLLVLLFRRSSKLVWNRVKKFRNSRQKRVRFI